MSNIKDEPLCGARAASCVCVKRDGHVLAGDEIHSCDPDICTGQWSGDFSDEVTFKIIRPPFPGPRNPFRNPLT